MKKKPLGLMIVAASALAALAVGMGAQGASDPAPSRDSIFAAQHLDGRS